MLRHLQAILPQHQVLNEVPREAPGPEMAVADKRIGLKPNRRNLVDEKIGADKIVAPVVEEGGDAQVILFAPGSDPSDPGERNLAGFLPA